MQTAAKLIFVFVASPYFMVVLMPLSFQLSIGKVATLNLLWALCGALFIGGSIWVLSREWPFLKLVKAAVILNAIGALCWAPSFMSRGSGVWIGWTGVALAILWSAVIYREYKAGLR